MPRLHQDTCRRKHVSQTSNLYPDACRRIHVAEYKLLVWDTCLRATCALVALATPLLLRYVIAESAVDTSEWRPPNESLRFHVMNAGQRQTAADLRTMSINPDYESANRLLLATPTMLRL